MALTCSHEIDQHTGYRYLTWLIYIDPLLLPKRRSIAKKNDILIKCHIIIEVMYVETNIYVRIKDNVTTVQL